MDFSQFFSDDRNAQLATLITMSPMDEKEKNRWLQMLPLMNEDDKKFLAENLEEDISDYMHMQADMRDALWNNTSKPN